MRPSRFAPRLPALITSFALSLPTPAYALRIQQREATPQRTGLEEVLQSGDPRAEFQWATRAGLEEPPIWPDTTPLELKNTEPVLILRAEGGFGDIAYLRKLLDAFNARGLIPVVAAVGTPEKQAEAMEKFERFTTGTPVSYTLWREQAGQLVQADGRPVERGRTLRPVLIQHFSQVNPNWSRDLAERLVPELFQPLYEPPGRFFLIGFNAPGNAFGGYLKPGQGEFLNLYQTPPTPPGVHEPNPIYTGNLFDLELKRMIEEIRPLSRKARRTAALEALKLPEELAEAAESKGGWASLYISQGGSPTQLEALTQAFSDSYRTAAFFTFFVKNPRLWYYPDDYWRPHGEIADSLKENPKVSFVDVSGIFGSRERSDAPILVVNLGRVTREGVRLLAGASDLMLAPGHNTFVNAMGMAASQVGPKVVLSMPVFRAEREELQQALRSMGARRTLEEIAAFDRLREPGLTPEVFEAAVERLTQLLKSRKRQQRFQRDIGRLATRAMGLSGDPTDGNLGNRLLNLLARVDRGAALSELVSAPRQAPEAVEEVRNYQLQAAEVFRRSGQEPQLPTAGLEEELVRSDRVKALGLTFAGQRQLGERPNQEDAFDWVPILSSAGKPVGHLFLAADGMGGLEAGEEASEAFIRGIPILLTGEDRLRENEMDLAELLEKDAPLLLRSLVTQAFKGVSTFIRQGNGFSGTTGLMVLVSGNTAYVAWVGDTRLYQYQSQPHFLKLVTEDDSHGWNSLRAEDPDADNLTIASQYHTLRLDRKNALRQSIGAREDRGGVNVHWQTVSLHPGDRLILSTDGVHEAIADDIEEVFGLPREPEAVVREIMRLAAEGGGHDNRAAVVVDFAGPSTSSGRTEEISPPSTETSLTSPVTATEVTPVPDESTPVRGDESTPVRGEPVEPQTTLPLWLLKPEERQLVVLAPEAAQRYSGLADSVGQVRSAGKLSFVVLPQDRTAIQQLVSTLAVNPQLTTVREFGAEGDSSLGYFDVLAQEAFTLLPRSPLEGSDFRMLMRQIFANLAGVEAKDISDEELDTVAAALGLGSQV